MTGRGVEDEHVRVDFKGKVVAHATRKSDSLLMFAVRNLRYRGERDFRKASPLRRIFCVKGAG